jgi:hypothetical protein
VGRTGRNRRAGPCWNCAEFAGPGTTRSVNALGLRGEELFPGRTAAEADR